MGDKRPAVVLFGNLKIRNKVFAGSNPVRATILT